MSVYVGLKCGKVHESAEVSEYYCGGCGHPVTDHDSYCRECGGAFQEDFATESTCEAVYDGPGNNISGKCWHCSNCGHDMDDYEVEFGVFCMMCGAKVVKNGD